MGSFVRTCAISRLAINPGDEVFWIYSKKDYCKSTYELSSLLSHQIRREQEYLTAKKKHEDFLVRFPESDALDSFVEYLKKYVDNPDVKWGFGEYDDYGGVEDLDIEIPDEDFNEEFETKHPELILIRKSVADEMAKFGRTLMRREWSENPALYEQCYAYCVILVAQLTRCNVYGFQLLGRLYPDMDEFKEIAVLHKIIKKEYNKMYWEEWMKDACNRWEDFCWEVECKVNDLRDLLKKGKK